MEDSKIIELRRGHNQHISEAVRSLGSLTIYELREMESECAEVLEERQQRVEEATVDLIVIREAIAIALDGGWA